VAYVVRCTTAAAAATAVSQLTAITPGGLLLLLRATCLAAGLQPPTSAAPASTPPLLSLWSPALVQPPATAPPRFAAAELGAIVGGVVASSVLCIAALLLALRRSAYRTRFADANALGDLDSPKVAYADVTPMTRLEGMMAFVSPTETRRDGLLATVARKPRNSGAEACSVCGEVLAGEGLAVVTAGCGHRLHARCAAHLHSGDTCPVCLAPPGRRRREWPGREWSTGV